MCIDHVFICCLFDGIHGYQQQQQQQALSAKHRSHRHHAHETEMTEAEPSRTPEDSVCSVEGPTETGGEQSAFSTSKSGIV